MRIKTQEDLKTAIVGVLLTLHESRGWTPASMIYLAFDMDMESYDAVVGVMEKCGFITRTTEVVTLTAKGRERAQAISEILEKKKEERKQSTDQPTNQPASS